MDKLYQLIPPNDLKGGSQLGFSADTLLVDNPTPFYWHLPDTGQFVVPWQFGAVFKLVPTEQARVVFEAPNNVAQTPLSQAQQQYSTTTFRYSDLGLAPQSGVNAPQAPAATTRKLILPALTTVNFTVNSPLPNGVFFIVTSTISSNTNGPAVFTYQIFWPPSGTGADGQYTSSSNIGHTFANEPALIRSPGSLPAGCTFSLSSNIAAGDSLTVLADY